MALVYGGTAQLFVPGVVYQYKSDGVIFEGESKEMFAELTRLNLFATREDQEERLSLLDGRMDQHFLHTRYFRGNVFNIPVEGGSRTYYLETQNGIDSWANKAAAFLGIFLMILGATGFALEKKLSRYQ